MHAMANYFKSGLEQIVLFIINKVGIVIGDTDGFIFSFILLPYFCYFFKLRANCFSLIHESIFLMVEKMLAIV